MAPDSLQALTIDVEETDHLVRARSKDELFIVERDSPHWAAMAGELRCYVAFLDVPNEHLTIPTTTDDLAAISAEC